jgi:ribonuclease T1
MFSHILSGQVLSWFKRTILISATFVVLACSGNGNSTVRETTTGREQTETAHKKPLKPRKNVHKPLLSNEQSGQIPPKVYKVLAYVRENGRAPEGYQGGRKFGNFEKRLPLKDEAGESMKYREWDVNPKKQGKNRGAERLITSEDKRAWYTRDHYDSFTEIK